MIRVKICGVTRIADALHAARAGADAVGLNFYERSPRYVSVETAAAIAAALPAEVCKVGVDLVFRDHSCPQRMVEITARGAGFNVIDQNACATHERGGYLMFFGIVGADGGNEASPKIQVFGQHGQC